MPHALQFLVLTMAGWLNRHQEDLIDYLLEENRILRQQLGSRRLRLTDGQRRRLAMRGKKLGRRALTRVAGVVTPDTILRWYRNLIAKKYNGSARRRPGGPMTPREIAELVVRMELDACAINQSFWVFAGALTDQGAVITVTDTETGVMRTWENEVGTEFEPIQDTSAFETCQ